MANELDKELLKLRVKIGNSFLRAFYPIDYRSNQNILRNIDVLLDRETTGLRTLASSTSQVNVKIGRILTMMNSELDRMQSLMDGMQNSVAAGDDVLLDRIDKLENASNSLLDFLASAGGYEAMRRLQEARRKGKGKGKGPPAPTQPSEEPKVKKGKYKLPKGMGIIGLAWGLWTLWDELQAIDPNLKKGEYRQAVLTVVTKAVASMGLMWVGAFLGAMVGGAVGFGVGAIPGFIAGLLGGIVADYALGDTVDQVVEGVVDYLYTGDEEEEETPTEAGPPPLSDSTMQTREAPTPALQTPEQQVSEQIPQAQVSVGPPIAGPTPPAPPAEQFIDGPVEYPGPVPPVDLQPFAPAKDESSRAKAAANEAASRAAAVVPTNAEEQQKLTEEAYGGDSAKVAGPLPPATGETLSTASQYLGMSEGKDRATLNSFITQYFQPWDVARTPWCSAFVNSVLAINNIPGTGSGWAKSFLDYGATVWSRDGGDVNAVQPGDIAVFTRGSGGHVGFVKSFTGRNISVVGGNQSDSSGGGGAVTESSRGTENLLAIVRPALADGGKVHPKKGGTLALIAEAGEPEYVVPQSKAIKFAHEMIAARPRSRTKKHTHYVVVPILT